MKSRLLIIGISCFMFGVANLILYLPDFGLVNTPFPFEEIQSIDHAKDVKGIQMTKVHHSFESALQLSPYWLSWSLLLYAGIVMLGGFFLKNIFKVRIRK